MLQSIKPLLNLTKSCLSYRTISHNSIVIKFFPKLINDNAVKKIGLGYPLIGSRNFSKDAKNHHFTPKNSSGKPPRKRDEKEKSSSISQNVVKGNQNKAESEPTLQLKWNPQSNQVYLQVNYSPAVNDVEVVNDKEAVKDKEAVEDKKPVKDTKNSEFCRVCNGPCKYNKDEVGKSNSNTQDKRPVKDTKNSEFCRLCNGSCKYHQEEVGKSNSNTQDKKPVKDTKNSEFCRVCKGPCKYRKNEVDRSNTNAQADVSSLEKDSNTVTILINKSEICRSICNGKETNLSSIEGSVSKSALQETPNIIKLSSVEKFDKGDRVKIVVDKSEICRQICDNKDSVSSRAEVKMGKTKSNSSKIIFDSSTSGSIGSITISMDMSEFCGVVCNEVETLTPPTEAPGKSKR